MPAAKRQRGTNLKKFIESHLSGVIIDKAQAAGLFALTLAASAFGRFQTLSLPRSDGFEPGAVGEAYTKVGDSL